MENHMSQQDLMRRVGSSTISQAVANSFVLGARISKRGNFSSEESFSFPTKTL